MNPLSLQARFSLFLFLLLVASLSLGQAKPTPDPNSNSLLQQMYLASGGHQWRRIAGADLSGDYDLGGLKGTFRQTIDFKNGRDVLSYDAGPTRGRQGTTQDQGWWADEKGLTTIQDAPEAHADAITQSYKDRNGWFYPSPAVPSAYEGTKAEGDRTFDLVRVSPPGGRELTLWIDSSTHRLDREIEHNASQQEETTYFSDYRDVRGVWFPFRQRQSSGDPSADVIMAVTQLQLKDRVHENEFAPPHTEIRDAHLLQNAASTIVPFTLRDGLILVDVSIDGAAPMPFFLDSGGLNLLTSEAAKKIGVKLGGNLSVNGVGTSETTAHYAQIARYQVGQAELRDQQFLVIPLPSIITSRGAGQEPIAGLIGYEVFRRFCVTIDYHQRQLTLARFSPRRQNGEALHLFFDGRTPFVKGAVDGTPGYFGFDTGDDGAITLFKGFFAAHDFPVELPGIGSEEGGVGGVTSTLLTRVDSLSLGSLTLSRPLTELNFASTGAFASKLNAGNIGSQVFQNFVITLDYEHRTLYLRKSPDFGYSMPYNRSGIQLDTDGSGTVKKVAMGSPAASAGLEAGDRIVTINQQAIDGEDPTKVDDQLKQPAGTRVELSVRRHGDSKEVAITLKELLPVDDTLQRMSAPVASQ
jgi:hypothetical protein